MRHGYIRALAAAVALVAAAGAGLEAVEAAGAGESSGAAIVVRTYTQPDVQGAIGTARSTAGAILGRAGVAVIWVECGLPAAGAAPAAACVEPLRSNELVVRILPAVKAGRATGREPDRQTLGVAFVDLGAGGGSLATVYADRVDAIAQSAGVDMAELLGRAMAHEIGHLLLGTNRHSSRGLMRASWTDDDLRRRVANEWLFDGREGEVMRGAVANRLRSYN